MEPKDVIIDLRETLRTRDRQLDQIRKLVRCESDELIDSLVLAATEEGISRLALDIGCGCEDLQEAIARGLLDVPGITLELKGGA